MSNFTESGVTNVAESTTLGKYIAPDPTAAYTWFDDFFNYTAGDWVITTVGAANANIITNAAGGILQITLDAADNDHEYFQWSGTTSSTVQEQFLFVTGKRSWGKFRAKINEVLQSDFIMGLYVTDTDPITAIVDGCYFRKDDGSATLSLVQTLNSTSTTTTAGTMVADTYCTFGYYYDGAETMSVYFNDVLVANAVTTNLCKDEELAVSFVAQAGEATNVKVFSIDYMAFFQER